MAFGDFADGDIDDEIMTGNQDVFMVISTVAQCVYFFVEKYPESIILIDPIDEKRKTLYNIVMKRRHKEIEQNFIIWGIFGEESEKYNPKKEYDSFEIKHKI